MANPPDLPCGGGPTGWSQQAHGAPDVFWHGQARETVTGRIPGFPTSGAYSGDTFDDAARCGLPHAGKSLTQRPHRLRPSRQHSRPSRGTRRG